MSLEPQEDDPAALEPPPRPLLGPLFWAMVGFATLCLVLGALVGFEGWRLFPRH